MQIINGNFIEDMERIYDLYNSRFVYFSNEYNFKGKETAKIKMNAYYNCVEKMKKVLQYIDSL